MPATGSTTTTCSRSRRLPDLQELNIGHAIVSRAVMSGFGPAVSEMKRLMVAARRA